MEVVGQAGDGAEAVQLVENLFPNVVLMDIRMPVMDGVKATREIFSPVRAARRPRPARVVVLTTFNLDDRAATAIRYGASGFLLKDAAPVQLTNAIRTVHGGNAVLAPHDLAVLLEGEFRNRHALPDRYHSLTNKEENTSPRWHRALATQKSHASGFSASRLSRLTSATSFASLNSATESRSSSLPTNMGCLEATRRSRLRVLRSPRLRVLDEVCATPQEPPWLRGSGVPDSPDRACAFAIRTGSCRGACTGSTLG